MKHPDPQAEGCRKDKNGDKEAYDPAYNVPNIHHSPVIGLGRLLKNARLLRFPHPSPFNVPASTPHGSGFRRPCIQTFLNSLDQRLFQQAVQERQRDR